MNSKIEKIKSLRQFLLSRIEGLTTEQLNAVPAGFNNNIIWNLAHLVAALQGICYIRSGLPIAVDERYVAPFRTGTKPERFIDAQEVAVIRALLIGSVERLQEDLARGIFSTYAGSELIATVYGVQVTTLEEAIDFLLYHEGLHAGYVLALRHVV